VELVKHGGRALLTAKDSVSSRCALHVAALADNDAFIEAACAQGADVDQVGKRDVHCVSFCIPRVAFSWILVFGRPCTLQLPVAVLKLLRNLSNAKLM
jgi:hypothetical protein